MKFTLLFLASSMLLFSSCRMMNRNTVQGDGQVISQDRSVRSFDRVQVSGGIQLMVSQDSTSTVKVMVDRNLQEYIEVTVEGSELIVRQRNNTSLNTTGEVKVYVSAPLFKSLHASGACNISSQNQLTSEQELDIDLSGSCDADISVKAPKVTVGMSGASSAKLKGQTKDLDIDGSGSSDVKAFELLAENVHVGISGAGEAEIYASVKLDVNGSGSSDVRYKGAATVTSDISGAGSVKKVD